MTQTASPNVNAARDPGFKLEPRVQDKLQSQAREVMNSGADKMSDFGDSTAEAYNTIRKNVVETATDLGNRSKKVLGNVDTMVKANPVRSSLIMMGVGVLVGLASRGLWGRKH